MKLRSSKTKLFYETAFKTEASKLKNEAFLRDFLQKWSFEALKRSFSARLPSKMKLRNSKTKLFCETSFKNDTSGTNRVTGDHKGAAPFLCDRCGTPSTLGHLWPYLFFFKTWKQWIGSQATNVPLDHWGPSPASWYLEGLAIRLLPNTEVPAVGLLQSLSHHHGVRYHAVRWSKEVDPL